MHAMLISLLNRMPVYGRISNRAFVRNALNVLKELEVLAEGDHLSLRAIAQLRQPLEDYEDIDKTFQRRRSPDVSDQSRGEDSGPRIRGDRPGDADDRRRTE